MRAWMFLAIALVACSSSSGSSTGPDGGATTGDAAGQGSSDAGGTGTIDGEAADASFTHAANSLWLGAPDSPATIVVYIFSNPVACSELAMPGWDTRVTDRTQILEMKMFGTTPATYTVVTTMTPAPGESVVNYTLSSQTGVPTEQFGTGGSVTVTAINANTRANGNFNLQFGSGSLSGSFDAAFCPGGHEP
jgi:hypothetical protein